VKLVRDPTRVAVAGTLGEVSGNELLVAPPVADAAARNGLTDALELASWAETFPDGLADELGWPPEDVVAAARRLIETLGGAPPSHEVSYGANPPPDVELGRTTARDLATRRRRS
jgi:hypothetical protein